MKIAKGEGTHDQVGIVDKINVEAAIVNSTTKDHAIRRYSNYTTLGFDHISKLELLVPHLFQQQTLINITEERWRG